MRGAHAHRPTLSTPSRYLDLMPSPMTDPDQAFPPLDYEISTFLDNGICLLHRRAGKLQNAVVEAYLVHVRLLAEFLGARGREPNRERDITPSAFGISWSLSEGSDADSIRDTVVLADKHL